MRGWQEVILALPAHNAERCARAFSISCVAGCAHDNCRRQHARLSTRTKSNVAVFLEANQREEHRILYEPSRVNGVLMARLLRAFAAKTTGPSPTSVLGPKAGGAQFFS
jgi:hypothetical protein